METVCNKAFKPLAASKAQVPLIQSDICMHILECNAKTISLHAQVH